MTALGFLPSAHGWEMDPLLALAPAEISFILQLNQPLNGKENPRPVSVMKTGGQGGS